MSGGNQRQSEHVAHGETQFGGEVDVIFAQHAVFGEINFVGNFLVLDQASHEFRDLLFQRLQIDESFN